MTEPTSQIELMICIKCRREGIDPDTEIRPGAQLHEALQNANLPTEITVKPVECLSNCSQGCSIALRGEGRWSYVYGNLAEDAVEIVTEGATKYQKTADGLVPWR